MKNYQDIRNELKKKDHVFWYDEKGKLILSGNSKSETKKKIRKLKEDGIFYRLHLTFHTGLKGWQGGPIAVNVKVFSKLNNIVSHNFKDEYYQMNGKVWFPLKFLQTSGWRDKYLDLIILKLLKGKLKFKGGIVMYTKL